MCEDSTESPVFGPALRSFLQGHLPCFAVHATTRDPGKAITILSRELAGAHAQWLGLPRVAVEGLAKLCKHAPHAQHAVSQCGTLQNSSCFGSDMPWGPSLFKRHNFGDRAQCFGDAR